VGVIAAGEPVRELSLATYEADASTGEDLLGKPTVLVLFDALEGS
jgi:hypothetical protein